MKPIIAYVIQEPQQKAIKLDTVRLQRKMCIEAFIKRASGRETSYTWKELKSYGWNCIKIKISNGK